MDPGATVCRMYKEEYYKISKLCPEPHTVVMEKTFFLFCFGVFFVFVFCFPIVGLWEPWKF